MVTSVKLAYFIIISMALLALAGCKPQVKASSFSINSPALYDSALGAVGGNPRGSVTLVEFFDYRCSACKQGFGALQTLLQIDPAVRVVYRELPIFGSQSVAVAELALGAEFQNKYLQLHDQLMGTADRVGLAQAVTMARKLSLNMQKLLREGSGSKVWQQLAINRQMANALGVKGIPVYLIARTTWVQGQLQVHHARMAMGALTLNQLKQLVIQANAS